VETGKYSGFWLLGEVESFWLRVESHGKSPFGLSQLSTLISQLAPVFFPPSPPATEHRHFACADSGHAVRGD
jgi:hypothetical protein